jgi:hypothetical protein
MLLLLTGCAEVLPFAAPALGPLPPRNAAEVAALDWSAGDGVLLVRQSVVFELGGRRFAMNGLLRLDRGAGRARLAGLDDFGVKLFDLSVTADGYEEHFLMPELARRPGLSAAVATSVRRIWLAPRPQGDDQLTLETDRYRLLRHGGAGELEFLFGGTPPQLLEKRQHAEDGEEWRVRYFEYQSADGLTWPRGIILDDERAGYRLTVRIESIRRGS